MPDGVARFVDSSHVKVSSIPAEIDIKLAASIVWQFLVALKTY